VNAETREYFEILRGAIASIQGEITSIHGEMASMQGDMASMRGDIAAGFAAVDRRFETVEARIDHTAADTRRHFEVTVEGMRHQMQVLAEGAVMNAEALNRFRAEFIAEIHDLRRGR
jgi:hypothetical protein